MWLRGASSPRDHAETGFLADFPSGGQIQNGSRVLRSEEEGASSGRVETTISRALVMKFVVLNFIIFKTSQRVS